MARSLMYFVKMFMDDHLPDCDPKNIKSWLIVSKTPQKYMFEKYRNACLNWWIDDYIKYI